MAEGNRITLEQALEILPKSLLEKKERDSEDNYTGRTWLDTEKFITSATGNVVPAWHRTVQQKRAKMQILYF